MASWAAASCPITPNKEFENLLRGSVLNSLPLKYSHPTTVFSHLEDLFDRKCSPPPNSQRLQLVESNPLVFDPTQYVHHVMRY